MEDDLTHPCTFLPAAVYALKQNICFSLFLPLCCVFPLFPLPDFFRVASYTWTRTNPSATAITAKYSTFTW
jgi:hypothetical protein